MAFAASNLALIDLKRRIVVNKTYHFGEGV